MISRLSPILTLLTSVLTVFIVAYIFFKFLGPIPFSVSQTTTNKASTFDVTGEGTESVVPNEATANFGITTTGPTVATVQSEINTNINRVVDSLKKLGIDEKDIKTTNYSINPNYDYQANKIEGYSASANVTVTFHDFNKVNQAFDAATASGANNAGQLSFGLSEEKQKEAENKATKQAIDHAKDKAQSLASLSGIKLGKLINVTTGAPIQPIYRATALSVEPAADQKTQVQPGTNEVHVTVTLSYETY